MILFKRQYFVVKRLVNSFDIVAGVWWWLICILGEAIFGMAAVAPAYSALHGDSTLLLPSSQSLQYLVVRNSHYNQYKIAVFCGNIPLTTELAFKGIILQQNT